jgi:hypothetical protein
MSSDSVEQPQDAVEQYRLFERECLEWAKTARTDHERQLFLQMAKAWSTVAELVRRVQPLEDVLNAFFDLAKSRSPLPDSTIQ